VRIATGPHAVENIVIKWKDRKMIKRNISVTALPAWRSLEAHSTKVRQLHLRKLFADDVKRGERMAVDAVWNLF
jgi:hypothetical protein